MDKRKTPPPVFGWAGVTDDKFDLNFSVINCTPVTAHGRIYPTKKEASRYYKRVRRVMVKTY